MTKQELMETYTEEQLAEMVIEAYEREDYPKIMAININGFPKMFTIKEIGEIVTAYEEIKLCQEQNKQCKTILPSEYLKVLSLNQTVSQLQSEVEKYRQAFENTKKERDCQIAEYQKKIEELTAGREFLSKGSISAHQDPIDIAKDLINAEGEYERNPLVKAFCGTDKGTYRIFDVSELRQIAEHLLVYCNHNGDVEE